MPKLQSRASVCSLDLTHQAAFGLHRDCCVPPLSTQDFELIGAAHSCKYPGCRLHPLLNVQSLAQ